MTRDLTGLLVAWRQGDAAALEQLVPLISAELKRMAAGYMRRERLEHTLQPTALVHEAFVRLVDQRQVTWQNRAQFFGVAAQLMRRLLVDHARARYAAKRGGEAQPISLESIEDHTSALEADRTMRAIGAGLSDAEVIAVDEALTELAKLDPRQSASWSFGSSAD